jgi:chemosensory pili system protein ChpA (sensor histidine kinase/response regulator)
MQRGGSAPLLHCARQLPARRHQFVYDRAGIYRMTHVSNWFAGLFQRVFRTNAARPGAPAISGDIDAEMRDIFLTELTDIIQNISKALAAWRTDFSSPTQTRAMVRAFHTLKGSAPIVGATQLAELGQAAEHATKQAMRKRNPDVNLIQAIETAVALLPEWADAVRRNQPVPAETRNVINALKRYAK